MDQLAYDLVLYLHEPGTGALLARIEERVPGQSPPSYDNGVLRCRVEEVIHGPPVHAVSVPYSRLTDPILRRRSGLNHWNALPLGDGDLLLLVGRPTEGNNWQALSGNQVASPQDAIVTGLKECYRIKDVNQGSEEHQEALRTGLVSTNPLPRRYGLDAIRRHEVVSRDVGCAIIGRALETADLDRESLLSFADCLSSIPIFDEDQGADKVNQQVSVSLAAIIERLAKAEDRVTCLRYLASCIMADFDPDDTSNKQVRSQLLQAIGKTPPPAVADTLNGMSGSKNSDDRDIAAELAEAWQAPETRK